MLPARRPDRPSLAEVLTSCLAAVGGSAAAAGTSLDLPAVDKAIVVLVDGLGSAMLEARAGHARTLARASRRVIEAGFPSTTAVSLASLATGLRAGEHGIVGYQAVDAAHDRVLNQLSGWDDDAVPEQWQPHATVFEHAAASGIDAVVIAPSRYKGSGYTRAVLRGARFLPGARVEDRVDAALDWLREPGTGVGYLYVPELDAVAHAKGWLSDDWTARLEHLDAEIARLQSGLAARQGVLVTADHGVIDLAPTGILAIDPALLVGVHHVAGEPRCLQLHLESGVDAADVVRAWTDAEGSRSWIVPLDEVAAAGWLGDIAPEVRPRLGDVWVIARKAVAYYPPATEHPMVGHHGALSGEELRVPVIGLGAFA